MTDDAVAREKANRERKRELTSIIDLYSRMVDPGLLSRKSRDAIYSVKWIHQVFKIRESRLS